MDASSLGQLPKTPALQRTTSTDSLPKLSQLGKTPPKPNPLAFQRSNSSSSLQSPPSLDISGFQSQLEQSSPAQLLQEKPPVKPTRLQQALTQGFAPVEVHNHFTGIATTGQLLEQMEQVQPEQISGKQVAQAQFIAQLDKSKVKQAHIQDLDGQTKPFGSSQKFQKLREHALANKISIAQAAELLEMGSGLGFGAVYYFRTDWSNGIRQQNTPLPSQEQPPEPEHLRNMRVSLEESNIMLSNLLQLKNEAEQTLKETPRAEQWSSGASKNASDAKKNYDTAQKAFTQKREAYQKAITQHNKAVNVPIAARVTQDEVFMAVQSLAAQGIQYAEVQISSNQAADPIFMSSLKDASQHFGVDTRLLIGQNSNAVLSGSKELSAGELNSIKQQLSQAGPLVMGIDFNGPEKPFSHAGMENFKRCYVAMQEVATRQERPLVLRPHIGEGDSHRADFAVEAENNIEMLLNKLQEMKNEGIYDPNGPVKVRLGHATHANPEQISRMKELGITAIETNISSNQETGSIREMLQHPLISQLIYEVPTILNTDGGGVMRTNLQTEYSKAQAMIDSFLNDQLPVTVPHDVQTQEFPAQMRFSDFVLYQANVEMYNRIQGENRLPTEQDEPSRSDFEKADTLIRGKVQLNALIEAGVNYWDNITNSEQQPVARHPMQSSSSSSSDV